MPRQIIIKLLKTKGKGKILKAIRKKKKKKADYLQGENNQKGDVSSEIMEDRRKWRF